MGSIVVRQADKIGTDKEVRVYTKGAPDFLLKKVSFCISKDGMMQPITRQTTVPNELLPEGTTDGQQDTFQGIFERTIKKFATQAYRTILVSYKDMSMREYLKIKQ